MNGLADLTDHEQLEYDAAGAGDRQWFRRHRGRRYRLRPAQPSETKVLAGPLPVTHVLVRKVHQHVRLRLPGLWTLAGALPDSDAVLARLHAGAVFAGGGGHA